VKYLLFYYLKKYRIVTGSNFRNAVIIGYTPEAIRLKELFETRNDYGYRFLGFFSDKKSNPNISGKLDDLQILSSKTVWMKFTARSTKSVTTSSKNW
jgi:putative colanic acid biosynthesis UDP-glucose lipid carrier transferase